MSLNRYDVMCKIDNKLISYNCTEHEIPELLINFLEKGGKVLCLTLEQNNKID